MSTSTCPKCRSRTLTRVHADDAPGVLQRCTGCHGHWLSEAAVHGLGEVVELRVSDPPYGSVSHERDHRTGLCPDGHGILARARVEIGATVFHLERCPACRGVFFDEGELSALATERLLGQLDRLFDPDYQRARRASEVARHLDEATRAALGDTLFDELAALAERLAEHPKRSMATAWLIERMRRVDLPRERE